ncbi:Lrp/AsnC family transcriptional regulator [Actinomycetota bacterium]
MVQAYVLIQTEVGKAHDVAQAISGMDGVASAENVTGPYDVIARVEAETMDELGRLVVSNMGGASGITRTLVCTVVNI